MAGGLSSQARMSYYAAAQSLSGLSVLLERDLRTPRNGTHRFPFRIPEEDRRTEAGLSQEHSASPLHGLPRIFNAGAGSMVVVSL